MIDVTNIITIWAQISTNTGTVLARPIIVITGGLVALLGLKMGLDYLYRWIFNYPGTSHYNPQLGSGMSRWQKGRRNSHGGVNLLE